MFKKLLLTLAIFWVILVAGGCAKTPPPQDIAADRAKLESDALSWFEHYANADADSMANLYSDDALLMPPGAPAVTGRPGIRSFLGDEAANSKAAGISLKHGSVTGSGVNGEMGWISGTFTVADSSGAMIDSGSFLSVHQRTNGVWLYTRDIWNSDRAPLPAAPAESEQ